MTIHAVPLKVTPCLRIECKFWPGEDGWHGNCEQPQITVHSGSYEQAKSDMESALGKHIESLLQHESQRARAEHAA